MQYQVKEEIRELTIFFKNGIVPIVIENKDKSSMLWISQNEFQYKGDLYDIVKEENNEGKCTFYCVNDKKEKKLISNLDEHIKNHIDEKQGSPNKGNKTFLKLIIKDYFFHETFLTLYQSGKNICFYTYQPPLLSLLREVIIPPPKLSSQKI